MISLNILNDYVLTPQLRIKDINMGMGKISFSEIKS